MIWILLFGIAMIASVAHALYDEHKKRKQAEQAAAEEDPIWEYARHLADSTAVRAAAREKELGE